MRARALPMSTGGGCEPLPGGSLDYPGLEGTPDVPLSDLNRRRGNAKVSSAPGHRLFPARAAAGVAQLWVSATPALSGLSPSGVGPEPVAQRGKTEGSAERPRRPPGSGPGPPPPPPGLTAGAARAPKPAKP